MVKVAAIFLTAAVIRCSLSPRLSLPVERSLERTLEVYKVNKEGLGLPW